MKRMNKELSKKNDEEKQGMVRHTEGKRVGRIDLKDDRERQKIQKPERWG